MSYKPQVWVDQPGVQTINQARISLLENELQQLRQEHTVKQPFDWRKIAGVGFLSVGLVLFFTMIFAACGTANSDKSFWGAFWSVLPGMSAFAGSILVVILGYVLVFND